MKYKDLGIRDSRKKSVLINMNRIRVPWWRPLTKWWQDYHWPIIGLIALFTLILGYIGFKEYCAAQGESRTPLDIFYLVLQLFILESGDITGPTAWAIEVARLLAPLVAAYAALTALTLIFREQLQLLRVQFIHDHVVICGLGRKGMLLTHSFCACGYSVVVIELDERNDMLDQCRDEGAIVLIGNGTDRELLRKARVHKAKYLFSVCGDDGINAEIAVHARDLTRDRKRGVLTCIVHIFDPQLCLLLKEREIEAGKIDRFRLEFCNVFDSGARAWLTDYPAFGDTDKAKGRLPHLVVLGIGKMGESLILHAAKKWKFLHPTTNKKPRITIIDKVAKLKTELLCIRYPQLKKVCDIVPLQMDVKSSAFQRAEFLFDRNKRCNVTNIFVCFDDDSFALSAALTLHQHIRKFKIPIVVRMIHDAGLASLLRGEDMSDESFAQLHAFGLLDRTCKLDLIFGGTHETLARAIHKNYVDTQEKLGQKPETNPSMVPWDELPEHLKESNRCQVDHIGTKLKAVGCGVKPLTDWDAKLIQFNNDEIELMAKMEHDRWMSERLRDGWKYKPGKKNIKKKTSPYLVPWEQLQEDIKELDREPVRKLPVFLAQTGFQIYRLEEEKR